MYTDPLHGNALIAVARWLRAGSRLYLQVEAPGDKSPGNTVSSGPNTYYRDSIYLAFANNDLSVMSVLRLGVDVASSPPLAKFSWSKSGQAWTASFGAPQWLVADTGEVELDPAATGARWAIDVEVDLTKIPGERYWGGVVVSPNGFDSSLPFGFGDDSFIEPNPPDTGQLASVWGAQFDGIPSSGYRSVSVLPDILMVGCAGVP